MEIRERLDNYLTREQLFEVADEIEESIGTQELLNALELAMSYDELLDNLRYIAREYDL